MLEIHVSLKPNSITLSVSKLIRSRFEAGRADRFETGSNLSATRIA